MKNKPTGKDVFHAVIEMIEEQHGKDAVPIMIGLWNALDAMFPPGDGTVSGDLHQDWYDISFHAITFQQLAALGESGFARLATEHEGMGDAFGAFTAYIASYYFGQLVRMHKGLPVSTQAEIRAAFDKESHRLGLAVMQVGSLLNSLVNAQKHA